MLGSGANGNNPIKEVEKLCARKPKLERVVSNSTERKKAEDEIKIFLSGIEDAYDGVAFTEMNGDVNYANEAAANIFGYSLAEMMKLNIAVFSAYPEEAKNLEEVVAKQGKWRGEITGIRKNKEKFPAILSVSIVKNGKGKPIGRMGIFRDITERTKAEQLLRKERDKAQKYLDVASVMLVAIDAEQRVGLINKKGCEILGYKEEEILGKNWFKNFLPERIRGQVKAVFEKVIRAEADAPESYENPILTKSGDERLIAWHNTVLKDEKGSVIATLSSGENITERKRAEKALRESEERYRALFENAGEGIITLDLDGRITESNRLVEEYGFNRAELNGRRLFDFVPGYDKARSVSDFQALVVGRRLQGQMDVITPKGIISVEYRDTPIVRAGEIIGMQAILTDITKRKKAEQALRESEEKYREIVELAPDGIVTVDLKGTMTSCNSALLERTGYSKEDFVGKHISKVPTARLKDIPKYLRIFSSLLMGKVPKPFEFMWIHKNGSKRWGELRVSIMRRAGKITGFQAITREITERKKAEEAYRSLVDYSLQGLSIIQDGRVVFANQALAEITGYTIDELLAMSSEQVQAFIHPEDRPLVWSRHSDRLNGEEVTERYEFRGIRKDGSTCWLELYASRIEYNGKPAIQAAYVDITERKKAAEAYRSLVDHSLQGLAIFQNGRVVFANQAMADITGYTVEEMLTLPPEKVHEFVHPDDRELVWNRHRGRLNGEELPERYEFRGIRKDGSMCWVEIHASRIEYQGKPAIQAAYVDITEEKRAREALQESEQHYRMLAETMNDGLGVIDEKGMYVYVNNKFGEMLGHSPDEMFGRHWTDFYDEQAQKIMNEQLTERKKGIAEPYELKNTRRDGQKIFIRISPQVIFDENGEFKGSFAIFTDITEQKKAEEQIAKLAKFPAENPHPVLRISGHGTVIYANKAGANLLKTWDCRVGKSVTDRWNELVMDSLSSGQSQQTEVQCDGQMFSLTFAPVVKANYVNVYGLDITERKKAEDELRFYSEVTVNMSEGVYAIRASDGIIVYTNPKFEEMFGYDPGELIGKHVSVINAPTEKSPQETAKEIIDVLNKKGVWRGEILNIKKDGTPFWCYASVSTFEHTEHKKVWVTMHTDITERKKAEEEVQNLAKFPSENPNAVFRVSKEGNILYANRTGEILLSCRKCFDNDKTVSKEWLKLITEAFTSKSEKAFEFECKNRFYSFIIAPVAEGGYANFYGRDITKRKKAEEKLLEDQAKLKAMASKMLMTEERERQRLAVGLHDEVCQKLVLTKLALESSLNLVSDSNLLASLRIVCEGIGETIEQADSLTFELSNPVLRVFGFVVALEKYLTEVIRQKHGIEYELQSDKQLSTLPDEIKNCLFRVTRELLTNVVKHAHACKVKVSARESQSQIYVRVQDDGVGFKESQAGAKVSQTARFGLFSIREQLEYLGGHLEIESGPGRGTTATVVVPLRDKAVV